ncbi:unnamed protein product [Caenorhabditis nigoni]
MSSLRTATQSLHNLGIQLAKSLPPWDMNLIWEAYKVHTKSNESVEDLKSRFENDFAPFIADCQAFDTREKAKLMIATRGKVDNNFLEVLEKAGKPKLDENQRLVSFETDADAPKGKTRGRKPRSGTKKQSARNAKKVALKAKNVNPYARIYAVSTKRRSAEGSSQEFEVSRQEEEKAEEEMQKIPKPKKIKKPKPVKAVSNDYQDDSKSMSWIKAAKKRAVVLKPQKDEAENESIVETPKKLSGKELLKNIRIVLIGLDNAEYEGLIELVKDNIKLLEANDKEIPSSGVKTMLDMLFRMIADSDKSSVAASTTSVKRVLELMRFLVITQRSDDFAEILQKIEKKLEKLNNRDQMIPFKIVCLALETFITYVSS